MASTYYSQAKLKTCFFFKVGVLFILLQTSYVSSKASSLPFNILETNYYINGLRNPTRVVNTPRKVVGGEKFPVAPLSLEHALRPPTNLYTSSAPHTATILSVKKITGENASTETYHIVFDHGRFLPHWEGQVFGVMPAPENPFTVGNSSQLRYFTSASSRYGDMFNGRTASLCVSLSVGSTSEVLIKSKPGDKIQLTGPSGEAMLLGNFNPKATHIFVATGTGIAPFRAHLRRFFKEEIPTYKFSGFAWLFHGVSNADSVLYEDEFDRYLKDYPENFRYDIALTSGEKYVQDIVVEYASEVLELLLKGAYIYLSGNKKMVTPIESGLNITANNNGKNWDEILETLKSNNQWRVEVY
ncbi:ferredoxin--NADP reductase, embryo isozyme, chloroplastic [Cannabis sativa]|uniref:ferredoxin--NADP reductase, embryo isozyme, chloroplastic n=1 Tax=Cannabis sativa TaxID=3483 RepID=UPI0029CA0753|nr:ferredoxin--NADP reductase, embryo isozyme, chloroplastic [Cannabis sativa]